MERIRKPTGIFTSEINSCYLVAALQSLLTIFYYVKDDKFFDNILKKYPTKIELICSVYNYWSIRDPVTFLVQEIEKDVQSFPEFSRSSMGDAMNMLIGLIYFCDLNELCTIELQKNTLCTCGKDTMKGSVTKSEIELRTLNKPISELIYNDLPQLLRCRKCKEIIEESIITMPKVLIVRCPKERIGNGFKLQSVITLNNIKYKLISVVVSNGSHATVNVLRDRSWYNLNGSYCGEKDSLIIYEPYILGAVFIRITESKIFTIQPELKDEEEKSNQTLSKEEQKITFHNSLFPIVDSTDATIMDYCTFFQFTKTTGVCFQNYTDVAEKISFDAGIEMNSYIQTLKSKHPDIMSFITKLGESKEWKRQIKSSKGYKPNLDDVNGLIYFTSGRLAALLRRDNSWIFRERSTILLLTEEMASLKFFEANAYMIYSVTK